MWRPARGGGTTGRPERRTRTGRPQQPLGDAGNPQAEADAGAQAGPDAGPAQGAPDGGSQAEADAGSAQAEADGGTPGQPDSGVAQSDGGGPGHWVLEASAGQVADDLSAQETVNFQSPATGDLWFGSLHRADGA